MFGFLIKMAILVAVISNLDQITLNKILTGLVTVLNYGILARNQLLSYLNI